MTDRTTDNVVILPVVTRLDCPPERVLNAALDASLAYVIIVGETEDGDLYFASSRGNGPNVLWDLERAKLALLHSGGAIPSDPPA